MSIHAYISLERRLYACCHGSMTLKATVVSRLASSVAGTAFLDG